MSNIISLSPNETYLKVLKFSEWRFAYIHNSSKYRIVRESARDVVHHLLAIKFNRHQMLYHSTKPVHRFIMTLCFRFVRLWKALIPSCLCCYVLPLLPLKARANTIPSLHLECCRVNITFHFSHCRLTPPFLSLCFTY